MGVADGAARRSHEPGGADLRGTRQLLLDDARPPARTGRSSGDADYTQARAAKRIGGDFAIKRIELHVKGEVEGLDEEGFQAVAAVARRDCPAANALTGTEIRLTAELL